MSTINQDLRNLKILSKLEIPELSLLHTVLVDYKGRRVLGQTMIPGILANSQQQQTQIQYGSLDDGKTIHNNSEVRSLNK